MRILTANLSGKVRKETLNGRKYLVAPVTMLVPGVLNGSKGKLLYTANEIAKGLPLWNSVPLTLGHPKKSGKFVSARTPEILSSYGLGYVFNTRIKGDKLVGEAWFDVDLVKEREETLLTDIESGKKTELSTGLITTEIPAEDGSSFNGVDYNYIAVNHRPDHLAILTEEEGACSLKDGCGVFNSEAEKEKETEEKVSANELSHDSVRTLLREELQEQFTQAQPNAWVYEVYDDYFVYEQSYKLFKQSYTKTDTEISFVGDAVEVVREVNLIPVTNEKGENMAKKELIDDLVANGCGCFNEEDRPILEKMTEDRLTSLVANAKKSKENELVANTARKGIKTAEYEVKLDKSNKLVVNALDPEEGVEDETEGGSESGSEEKASKKGKVVTNKKSQLDPEVSAALKRLKRLEDKEKTRLVSRLVVNVRDEDTKEEKTLRLAKKSIEDLEELIDLVGNTSDPDEDSDDDDEPVARSFFGSAIANNASRRQKHDPEDILDIPTVNFKS